MGGVQPVNDLDWERHWAPYDPPTYQAVLDQLSPTDTVLEIGAGDLRLARKMARVCRKVYAIEIQPALVDAGTDTGGAPLPANLTAICGDARSLSFPADITTGVLLMRHCTHFHSYAARLKAAGCFRLITNARWRLGVETVLLQTDRTQYRDVPLGWYACWCGATGFVSGPAEQLTPDVEATVHEVVNCPQCRNVLRRSVV